MADYRPAPPAQPGLRETGPSGLAGPLGPTRGRLLLTRHVRYSLGEMPVEETSMDALLGQFHEYLGRKDLKSTKQRDLIARAFFVQEGHISIDGLLALVREQNPRVGYATVYRTLKLLTECGLAALRQFGDGQRMYEIAGDTAHHDHLICVDCNHVLEFENEDIERLQEKVARSFGFSLVRHKLELYGLCPRARGIKGGSCPRDSAERETRN